MDASGFRHRASRRRRSSPASLSWDLVRLLGERREAWDDPIYWQLAFPLMLFTALLLGLPRVAIGRGAGWRP